jgi:hypothetical protein
MKPPAPNKPAVVKKPAPAPQTVRRDAGPVPGPRADVKVRFYSKMNLQRVYPLVVEVPRASGKAAPASSVDPVVVRPVIPGAFVVPAEQRLDVSKPGAQVTFQVTPLARGRLPGARLELHQPGQAVQTLPLGMKTVTQRMTWVLLALTFLLPLGLLWAHYNPIKGNVPREMKVFDPNAPRPLAPPGQPGGGGVPPGGAPPMVPPGGAGGPGGQVGAAGNNGKPPTSALGGRAAPPGAGNDDKKRDGDQPPAPAGDDKKPPTCGDDGQNELAVADDKKPDDDKKPADDKKADDKKSGDDDKKPTPAGGDDKKPAAGDDKKDEKKDTPPAPPGGRQPPGAGRPGGGGPPMGPGGMRPGGGGPGGPGAPGDQPPAAGGDAAPPADATETGIHIHEMPAAPDEYVTYHLDKGMKDLVPDVDKAIDSMQIPWNPRVWEKVRPSVASTVGTTYGYMTDRPIQRDLNWIFWAGVVLLMLTGLSWISHGGRRTTRRKTIELTTSSGDAQALETLPLNPPEAHGSGGLS